MLKLDWWLRFVFQQSWEPQFADCCSDEIPFKFYTINLGYVEFRVGSLVIPNVRNFAIIQGDNFLRSHKEYHRSGNLSVTELANGRKKDML